MSKFQFRPCCKLLIGIERECFLVNGSGEIVPIAQRVLEILTDRERFGYELSACQLEDRIGPCNLSDVKNRLLENEKDIMVAEDELRFKRMQMEVAPEDMPLDVYPDPVGRYKEIVNNLPRNVLLSACRVIGTHVHVGMPNYEIALKVYNRVIPELNRLCDEGDGSSGQRLKIYKTMAPDQSLRPYKDWSDFHRQAIEKDFANDPRKCWHLIRISVHGTIEFRMFGTTGNLDKIERWAKICHNLCRDAMEL